MKSAVLAVVLLLNVAVPIAFGCSLRPLELRRVSPDLTVAVTHRQRRISGIKIEVTLRRSESVAPVFSGMTDDDGTVLIRGLLPGEYWLTASHLDIEAGKEWIEVVPVPDTKTKKRFDFEWADDSYQTREVAGTLTGLVPGNTGKPLMDIVHPRETAFAGVDITLKSAFSNDEYRTVSDSTGVFLISEVPEGVYLLTIAGGMKSLTGIADVTRQVLDVTHTAATASLSLKLKDTGCYRTEFRLTD